MKYLLPNQAVEARKSVSLSQARVARDVGISRIHLSEFECSKRVLDDKTLDLLHAFYQSNGWEPSAEVKTQTPDEALQLDGHELVILDGFVAAPESYDLDIEELVDEYYELTNEIIELKCKEIKRGFFGGIDEEKALSGSIRPLILMARKCEIIELIQGQKSFESAGVNPVDLSTVSTMGDYIECLLIQGIPDRVLPAIEAA